MQHLVLKDYDDQIDNEEIQMRAKITKTTTVIIDPVLDNLMPCFSEFTAFMYTAIQQNIYSNSINSINHQKIGIKRIKKE